jgi:uncharacterized alkaline shock family protein YloU
MTISKTPTGDIFVSSQAIASIAYQAAIQTYGVVGLASKNIFDSITNIIVKDPTHGIDVDYSNNEIVIDIYILLQFGTSIKAVANTVAKTIHYQVEKMIGSEIKAVNVHVQGLRKTE